MREREAQKKIVQQFGKVIIDAAEANLREADARIVEKTDPARAEIIRKLVPPSKRRSKQCFDSRHANVGRRLAD
jgi:hypothetical protein